MLFNEYYSEYYACVSEIIREALDGTLTQKRLADITRRKGFAESVLTIPAHLMDGTWPLITKDYGTPLHHPPVHPETGLQKRWLKTLLSDPRIRLFGVSDPGLEDVEPLFDPQKIIWYDRYSDGDPYEDPGYAERFRTLLEAVKTHRKVRVEFVTQRNEHRTWGVIPYRLEYSAADDKFRLLCLNRATKNLTLNLNRISSCRLTAAYDPDDRPIPVLKNESVTLEILDERNVLERAMLQFSYLAKKTERITEKTYRMTLHYRPEDETELLIKIISFGPLVKVVGPDGFAALIRERLEKQFRRNPFIGSPVDL